MKILKHGKLFNNKAKITCKSCKCKFEYTKKDIQKIIWKSVVCPECGEKIYID